jgi:hypothetical protein
VFFGFVKYKVVYGVPNCDRPRSHKQKLINAHLVVTAAKCFINQTIICLNSDSESGNEESIASTLVLASLQYHTKQLQYHFSAAVMRFAIEKQTIQ